MVLYKDYSWFLTKFLWKHISITRYEGYWTALICTYQNARYEVKGDYPVPKELLDCSYSQRIEI